MEKVNVKKLVAGFALGAMIAVPTMMPSTAAAQTSHRQKQKNQWRNLGIAGGVLGAAGLITHNSTLAAAGLAGGAYSAYRYEQDRKSQSRERSRYRRAQRFVGRRHTTRYRHNYHHDNGLHKGWYKNGKAWHH